MMQIRNMQKEDVAQIAALEKLCFCDPWSENSIASQLPNPLALWLVAEQDGRVLGYIGSQSVMDEADMMNVAVHPDARGRGIAQALITGLVGKLNERGVRSLSLEVRVSNAAAIGLYEKLDFVRVGCRPNYYRHPKENALILRKSW